METTAAVIGNGDSGCGNTAGMVAFKSGITAVVGIEFCKTHIFLLHSHVVKHLLAVPAASTSSERLFSMAGLTLSDRRASLSGDSVDGLLFIHGMG